MRPALTLEVPGSWADEYAWRAGVVGEPRPHASGGITLAVAAHGPCLVRHRSADHVLFSDSLLLLADCRGDNGVGDVAEPVQTLGHTRIAIVPLDLGAVAPNSSSAWRTNPPLGLDLLEHLARPHPDPGSVARATDLLRALLVPQPTMHLPLPISGNHPLVTLEREIWEWPGRPHEIQDCARALGVSVRTLSRSVKSATGMSFKNWRTQLRLHRSVYELISGSTVAAVAARVGYCSVGAYSHAFKSATGVTPGSLNPP